MYLFLWFSANFYNVTTRHNTVHIYKLNNTLYEVTHASSTRSNGPLFPDAVLVAEGHAEYVRNKPMNFFIARGIIRRYLESQEVYPDMLSFFVGLSTLLPLHVRPISPFPVFGLPVVTHSSNSGPCSICLCDIEIGSKVAVLDCTHSFHYPCISKWILINPSCPLCRAEISLSANNAISSI